MQMVEEETCRNFSLRWYVYIYIYFTVMKMISGKSYLYDIYNIEHHSPTLSFN
jgi:hypothetical protein